jgi:threonine aldolase
LLCLENTHNGAGGTVTTPQEQAAVVAAARTAGLAVHLDGARIWNAAVALGVAPSALTVGVDTVQVCLSKGLGAPVGSLFAGPAEAVRRARRLRKMLGGGVRQGGMMAAAGLVALDRIDRLAEDHARAEALAAGLRERGWRVTAPETNILLVEADDPAGMVRLFAQSGVRTLTMSGKVRFVVHADITDADIAMALDRIGTPAKYAERQASSAIR